MVLKKSYTYTINELRKKLFDKKISLIFKKPPEMMGTTQFTIIKYN